MQPGSCALQVFAVTTVVRSQFLTPSPKPPTRSDDLAAIVFTVHGCLATQLREFDFATHYISNAECMAVGNMTGAHQQQLPCCCGHCRQQGSRLFI